MKYRVIREKLDWRGDVTRTVSAFEDDFRPELSAPACIAGFVEKGDKYLAELPKPRGNFWDLTSNLDRGRPANSFSGQDGVFGVFGEYFPDAGVQFVLVSRAGHGMRWVNSDRDMVEEALDGVQRGEA